MACSNKEHILSSLEIYCWLHFMSKHDVLGKTRALPYQRGHPLAVAAWELPATAEDHTDKTVLGVLVACSHGLPG